MKIRREIIRPTGLTAVYEPDVLGDDPGLDIIFIHGIGGHPVKTWLYTPPAPISLPPSGVTTTSIISESATTPNRSKSLRNWVSSSKIGNTVKKFPFSPENGQQFRHGSQPPVSLSSLGKEAGEATPWRSFSASGNGEAGRGQRRERGGLMSPTRPAPGRPLSSTEAAIPGHFHERLIFSVLPSPIKSPKSPTSPTTTIRFASGTSSGRPLTRSQFLEERKSATRTSTRYWPQDFLPNSCPNSRVYVWGFKTMAAYEQGHIMQDQFDIFSGGRQLLESLEELQRSSPPSPGSTYGGKRREVVFVVHSTGGIIVKEMLRLASSFSDTHDEDLLASIAGIVFLGCPLRDTSDLGTMVDAMRSMAGYTTAVSGNDEVLRELLGGSEDEQLAHLGRQSFDALRNEYNFPIKLCRETRVVGPWNDWTERGLALRRNASFLDDHAQNVEDIESDHIGMARFSSADNQSYQSIASFIVKLAYCQSLKARSLTERDKSIAQTLFIPTSISPDPEAQRERTIHNKSPVSGRTIPQWLLNNPHTQTWLHRRKNSSENGAAATFSNKVLWLSGPTGSARSDFLASLRQHIQTRWAPETHSSVIISVSAGQDQSRLQSVLKFGDGEPSGHHHPNATNESCVASAAGNRSTNAAAATAAERAASAAETSISAPTESLTTPRRICSTATVAPARILRSLLSQLYTHDARLRNLVRWQNVQVVTAGSLHGDGFETPSYQSRDLDNKLINATPCNNLSSSTNNSALPDEAILSVDTTTDTPGPTTASRRWSDPIGSLSGAETREWWLVEQEAKAGRTIGRQIHLDDADVVNLFLDDYLGIEPTAERQRNKTSAASTDLTSHNSLINVKDDQKTVQIPGVRRVFILIDAADVCAEESVRDLLWYLGLLAGKSDFSICVATMELDIIDWSELNGDKWQRPMSDSLLPVVIPDNNNDEIRQYVLESLVPDMEERYAIAAKMVERAGGLQLWAELVVGIVNDASEEGVSGEVILSMLDDITPPRLSTRQSKLNALYSWKLGRMSRTETSQALVLMQWVMLAPEPLRLNELLVAMRLTMLTWPRAGLAGWDMKRTLDVEPAMSLKDLRKSTSGEKGITMDSPLLFWRWVSRISQGLLRLESAGKDDKISSEPLALQRVLPADESVQLYFLQGQGFQSLLALSEDPQQSPPSTENFVDGSYCNMLHACLLYLNMSDLESLGRGAKPLRPMPDDLPIEEKRKWRKNAEDQRRMVMSSYPFLRYSVDNLVFHLLCPRANRYFLPQKELLHLLTANRCRIWRRWTHLLGFSIADADPKAILSRASQGAAKSVLDPVYGANYRLERVLRKVWKTALDQQLIGMPGSAATSPRTHLRSRSEVSESSMVFTLVGSDDPEKAQWLVPTSPRSRSASSPAAPSPRSPKSLSPRYLAGIQELM